MSEVNVTELRQNLPEYLADVRKGKELKITVHGKVIARIVPEADAKDAARKRLAALRLNCKVGDVVSPTDETWTAERGRS